MPTQSSQHPSLPWRRLVTLSRLQSNTNVRRTPVFGSIHAHSALPNDIGSAIDSYTPIAGSYYTEATAAAASGYSDGLSAVSVGVQEASTWLVFVTDIHRWCGREYSDVCGAGVVTSLAGSEYTVIAGPTSTTNTVVKVHPVTLKGSPVLTALVTVVGGTLLGASIMIQSRLFDACI